MEKEFYSEKEASETIRPIIDAIKYCHSLNIIHRDIKVTPFPLHPSCFQKHFNHLIY
jgi:serine/threonine protein kinase